MSDMQRNHWETVYSEGKMRFPQYDQWLEKHLAVLREASFVVDLGCGNGADTVYLSNQGIRTIACDFSQAALKQLKDILPEAKVLHFDMREGLPFESDAADVVIADLSLHYFHWQTTCFLVSEIFRTLTKNGVLLCRLNALAEHRASKDEVEIEPHYYFVGDHSKRFFDEADIRKLFDGHSIIGCSEGITTKYGGEKHLWEVIVKP